VTVPHSPNRRETLRELRAIAALETLDGIRSRRQLVVRTVTPLVLFACVLAVTLKLRGADTATHPERYRIAVEGDFAGAKDTLERLRPDRLEFFAAPDARVATIDQADAGLHVPDRLDALVNDPSRPGIPLEIYVSTLNPPSRAAAAIVTSAFVDQHTNEVRAEVEAARSTSSSAAPTDRVVGTFAPLTFDVERTVAGTRTLTSQVIPGLVCLQAALLVTGTANRLVSRRTRGLLMSQLLLPVSRRSLAMAKGVGELAVGMVTAAPVVVALIGFAAIIAVRDGSAIDVAGHTLATVVAMVALFAFTTTVGVLIGTAARTQEQVSLATGAAVIVAALVATTIALGTAAPPTALVVIPFAGLVGTLREVLNGTGSYASFFVALLSTAAGTFALSVWGGRTLDAERLVMRDA
jgi:ABC-type transport system involved in multi-copper enzyme maturation permease subunit